MASGCLKEIGGPGRRTGWGSVGQPQMGENLGDHRGVFDGEDERQGAATVRTGCQVDFKHPFEQLSPAQAGMRPSATLNKILDSLA